ncbi:MAG: hypothetical protein IK116_08790 [Firmicutes bacterium]|nr:hypothetical protein [Bacillota bacterium]
MPEFSPVALHLKFYCEMPVKSHVKIFQVFYDAGSASAAAGFCTCFLRQKDGIFAAKRKFICTRVFAVI